ncbi:hypothetical protein B0H17DRAFT_129053 [Mycena rosella]|uniref:Uncharacterized protein n=1 Tax=Mycena rosella TaxID=1033263 RepID=A0AAD7GC98_MYCRO|nr:hypothetical protein B0H17DRAFT_129053 [Mycena rosella]
MVFNNAKAMHPHKDIYYTSNPVAAANLQNYWVHRQNYLSWHPTSGAGRGASQHASSSANTVMSPYAQPGGSTLYSTNPTPHSPAPSTSGHGGYFSQGGSNNAYPASHPAPGYGYGGHPHPGFNTLSPQPVVVPAGFTETHPGAQGWWRNPETGWFWHASRGLLPPSAPR